LTDITETSSLPGPLVGAHEYAGFWIRVAAWLIDSLIICLIWFVVAYCVDGTIGFWIAVPYPVDRIGFPIGLRFGAAFTASAWQGSPGKRCFGLTVTRLDGKPISLGLALAREITKVVSASVLCIGFIMVAFTKQRMGFHDFVWDTRVRRRMTATKVEAQ